jgi:hypothetical protein
MMALIAGAGAVALALSGCAATSAISRVADPVAQAAEYSELAPGFRMSFSADVTESSTSMRFTSAGSGVFNRRTDRAVMNVRVEEGEHASSSESQYTGAELYMRLPSSDRSSAVDHKPWIEYDVRSVDAAVGINLSSLESSGAYSSSPDEMLSFLRATGARALRIGSERVRGAPTTHYRATIDYRRYANVVAPAQRATARASVAALERLTGTHTQVVDVWIDRQHRVRREELTYTECVPGGRGTSQFHVELEYFDFAVQAIPPVPRKAEVANVTGDVVKALEHEKPGCRA